MISPVLIGGFVEMDRELLYNYAPYWVEVFLDQEVCSTTPIQIKSYSRSFLGVKKS